MRRLASRSEKTWTTAGIRMRGSVTNGAVAEDSVGRCCCEEHVGLVPVEALVRCSPRTPKSEERKATGACAMSLRFPIEPALDSMAPLPVSRVFGQIFGPRIRSSVGACFRCLLGRRHR